MDLSQGWSDLGKVYEEKGLVLALGAGVSVASGIPNWEGLLKRLADDSPKGAVSFDEMRRRDVPFPVIASILQGNSTQEDFVRRVRESLYRDFKFFPRGVSKDRRSEFLAFMRRNTTLDAVARLCAVGDLKKSGKYKRNWRIAAVVTFNLDALLQTCVRFRYGSPSLLRTVERASASPKRARTSLYHMHGFLRFDKRAGDLRSEAPDGVVLTEQNYFDVFGDPSSLFNYSFLHLLRESSCLFVGCSMNDENIRRLLHYSRKERVRSFVNEGRSLEDAERKSCRHFAILQRTDRAGYDRAVKKSLLKLGTRVLWTENHAEIPERLKAIYRAAGDRWSRVSGD